MEDNRNERTMIRDENDPFGNNGQDLFRREVDERSITDLTNQLSQDFGTSIGLQTSFTAQNDIGNSQMTMGDDIPTSDLASLMGDTGFGGMGGGGRPSLFGNTSSKKIVIAAAILCLSVVAGLFILNYDNSGSANEEDELLNAELLVDDPNALNTASNTKTTIPTEDGSGRPSTNDYLNSINSALSSSQTSSDEGFATLPGMQNNQVEPMAVPFNEPPVDGQTYSKPSQIAQNTASQGSTRTSGNIQNGRINAAQGQGRNRPNQNIINVPPSAAGNTTIVNNVTMPEGGSGGGYAGAVAPSYNSNTNMPSGSSGYSGGNGYSMSAKDYSDTPNQGSTDGTQTYYGSSPSRGQARTNSRQPSSSYTGGSSSAVVQNGVQAPENPYWALPNQLFNDKARKVSRVWNSAESTRFQAGLTHKYNYQRYKAVLDVKEQLLEGSESILYAALDEKKLWIRMNAAMGLGDFGVALDIDTVEKALGNEDPELTANFFKRYSTRPNITEGELYVMRQAIRVVNSKARLQILRTLKRQDVNLADLYLVAGTYDPARLVKQYARSALKSSQLDQQTLQSYHNVVLGIDSASRLNISSNYTPNSSETVNATGTTDNSYDYDNQKVEFYERVVTDDEEDAVPAGDY